MVVDVATALMYSAQGHSSLFPMFGLDTMSTLGKNYTHFLLDIGIVYLGEELYSLSVVYWYCLQWNHCWANGVRAIVPLRPAEVVALAVHSTSSTRVRVAIQYGS